MRFVFSDAHAGHDPAFFIVRGQVRHSAEQPERARILKVAAERTGLAAVQAASHGRGPVLAVHTLDYLVFLEQAQRDWRALAGTGPEVVANVHPQRRDATYPRSIVGRAGWHMADAACPIGPATCAAAMASADVAVTAADLVLAGERAGLCALPAARPPRLCRHGRRLLFPQQHRDRRRSICARRLERRRRARH